MPRLRWRRLWRTAWRSLARGSSWCWGTRTAPQSTAPWTAGSRRRPPPGPGPPEHHSKVMPGVYQRSSLRPDVTILATAHTHALELPWIMIVRRGPLHGLSPLQCLRKVRREKPLPTRESCIDTVLQRGMRPLPVRLTGRAVWHVPGTLTSLSSKF